MLRYAALRTGGAAGPDRRGSSELFFLGSHVHSTMYTTLRSTTAFVLTATM